MKKIMRLILEEVIIWNVIRDFFTFSTKYKTY